MIQLFRPFKFFSFVEILIINIPDEWSPGTSFSSILVSFSISHSFSFPVFVPGFRYAYTSTKFLF